MRPRKKDRHLPACVYRRHNAYFLVRAGKWTRLGGDLRTALERYAALIGAGSGTVAALIERAIGDAAERVRPSTLKQYRTAAAKLQAALIEFTPEQVQPRHVAQLMDHHRHTPNMANRMRSVLKLAFDIAVRAGTVPANPVSVIAPHRERRRDRYLTGAEYRAIWQEASPTLRDIIDLCYLTAQRISDVLSIRLADLTDAGIEIRQQKTGKRLLIRWSPDLRAVVDGARGRLPERKIVRIDAPGYLLAQRTGRIRSYGGVRDLWRRACLRAGVADAHLHDLRAKSLTDADRQGIDAQHLAGHSTQAMTARYLRDRTPTPVDGPRFSAGVLDSVKNQLDT
jgi:integrase